MGIRITGAVPNCCDLTKKCLNASPLAWVGVADAGGGTIRKSGSGIIVNTITGTTQAAEDASGRGLIKPTDRVWCFRTTVQRLAGTSLVGLTKPGSNPTDQLIYLSKGTGNWTLNLSGASVNSPAFDLGVGTEKATFTVCRKGDLMTVRVNDGAIQTFAPANLGVYPNVAIVPFVIALGTANSSTHLYSFCLTK